MREIIVKEKASLFGVEEGLDGSITSMFEYPKEALSPKLQLQINCTSPKDVSTINLFVRISKNGQFTISMSVPRSEKEILFKTDNVCATELVREVKGFLRSKSAARFL